MVFVRFSHRNTNQLTNLHHPPIRKIRAVWLHIVSVEAIVQELQKILIEAGMPMGCLWMPMDAPVLRWWFHMISLVEHHVPFQNARLAASSYSDIPSCWKKLHRLSGIVEWISEKSMVRKGVWPDVWCVLSLALWSSAILRGCLTGKIWTIQPRKGKTSIKTVLPFLNNLSKTSPSAATFHGTIQYYWG